MKNYTSKQIEEDFKYLKKQLAGIHSNPFLNISKEELNNNLGNLELNLLTINITYPQLILKCFEYTRLQKLNLYWN